MDTLNLARLALWCRHADSLEALAFKPPLKARHPLPNSQIPLHPGPIALSNDSVSPFHPPHKLNAENYNTGHQPHSAYNHPDLPTLPSYCASHPLTSPSSPTVAGRHLVLICVGGKQTEVGRGSGEDREPPEAVLTCLLRAAPGAAGRRLVGPVTALLEITQGSPHCPPAKDQASSMPSYSSEPRLSLTPFPCSLCSSHLWPLEGNHKKLPFLILFSSARTSLDILAFLAQGPLLPAVCHILP